jgi:Fe-S-cluster-containing hydrogenase component 2
MITVNEEECVGCETCVDACSIGAINLHPRLRTPQICDLCDGNPLCVEKCPTKALTYVETEVEEEPKPRDQLIRETLRKWGFNA